MVTPKPDYLSRDFAGLRQSLLQYAQQVYPDWQPSSQGDLGMVLLELWAYMGDITSYYTDRAQFENYLPTATQRESILNLAFMLGYVPGAGAPSKGTVNLTTDKGTVARTVPAGTRLRTNRIEALDGPLVFETDEEAVIPANPAGTISAVTVAVTEGQTVSFAYLGESTGLPGQVLSLPNTGIYTETIQIFVEDSEGEVKINEGTSQEVTVSEWSKVDKLFEGDGTDLIFETRLATSTTQAYFGDGINGAVPATGLKIYATYRYGRGALGNVSVGLVRMLDTTGANVNLGGVRVARDGSGAYLSSEMTGGADPESNDSIRLNAPRVYRTQDRIVTSQDFEEAALAVEGVTKAVAMVGTFTSVTLYISGPDGAPAGTTLKEAVLDRLDGRTLAGVTVTINDPQFVDVNFGSESDPVEITVKRGRDLKHVSAAVKREIVGLVGRLEFEETLTVSKVHKAVNSLKAVTEVEIPIMAREGEAQTGTAKINPQPWEILRTSNSRIKLSLKHEKKKNRKND